MTGGIVAEVATGTLTEWKGVGSFDHFVSVNGITTDQAHVNWVDTAYQGSDGANGNTFDNYSGNSSDFYAAIMDDPSAYDVIW